MADRLVLPHNRILEIEEVTDARRKVAENLTWIATWIENAVPFGDDAVQVVRDFADEVHPDAKQVARGRTDG